MEKDHVRTNDSEEVEMIGMHVDEHDDEEERKDNIPKDRGWAWFILLAATLDMMLITGILKCSGILFVAFQERFHSSSSMTSLLSTIQNICQSITALLAMTFGVRFTTCRNMLFLGSVITCVAYVITSKAPNVRLLLFSQGVLQGTGMGFMFPTALCMVGLYFEKRHGLANSIAVSGGSVGGLIFAPMITKLFDTYGYQGCFLILAGLLLNGCVIATLLRPTSFYTYRSRMRQKFHQPQSEMKKLVTTTNDTETFDKQIDLEPFNHRGTNISVFRTESNSSYSANDISKKQEGLIGTHAQSQDSFKLIDNTSIKESLFPNSSDTHILKSIETYIERRLPTEETPNKNIHENNSSKKVIQMNEHKLAKLEDKVKTNKPDNLPEKSNYRLLMNPMFWALILQGSLSSSGSFITPIFIAPYARDIGVTADEVATLVTALSCVDWFARIAVGFISDKHWLRRSSIIAIATLVISFSASLLRFYTNYVTLLGYAIVLGLVSGAYFSLYAVVLIDYLTLEHFQTCLGVVFLVNGFSTAGMFYIMGYLRDTTGSYVVPHHVIGVTTVFGAIILLLLPWIERFKT